MITHTTETSNLIYARVTGLTFLFYIVAGMTSLALADESPVTGVLTLLMNFSALVLGVTLYMITREQGPALAMLALTCRVLEAVSGEAHGDRGADALACAGHEDAARHGELTAHRNEASTSAEGR